MTNDYLFIRKHVRCLCVFALTLLLGSNAFAQGNRYTLRGRVTDAAGATIPGVTVLLRGTTQGTTTVADGTYSMGVTVAPGSYTLTFSSIGYAAANQSVTLGNQETVSTDVTLTDRKSVV